jgi:hypothetical protein
MTYVVIELLLLFANRRQYRGVKTGFGQARDHR